MGLFTKLILITVLINTSFAEDKVVCAKSQAHVSDELDKLSAENCKTINELNKCVERKIDPDALKKKITSKLNAAEKNKEHFIKRIKEKRSTQFGNLFSEYGARGNYEFLFDTLKRLDSSVDTEKLKGQIIDKYLGFAEKNDCNPRIQVSNIWRICPARLKVKGNKYNHIEEFKKLIALPENEEERVSCLSHNRGEEGVKHLMICNNKPIMKPRKNAYRIAGACAGNFIQNFKDNAWSIPEFSDLLSSGKLDQGLLNCLKKKIAEGAKIDKISIRSSSNQLNNTGEAAKRFCKKGFKALSEARATYAKEELVPDLLKEAGVDLKTISEEAFRLNSNGDNGNGTSGPCPYKYNANNKEYMDSSFGKSGNNRSEIEKGKYLKISISFKEQRTKLHNQEYVVKGRHHCKRINFKCSE